MQLTLRPDFKRIANRLLSAVFFCSLILFPGTAPAQDVLESLQLDASLSWPDTSPNNLQQADGTLFFAVGNVLVLLDSETFQEQSRIALDAPSGIQGIAVNLAEEPVVYAACGGAGLQVVDISDRFSPTPGVSLVQDKDSNAINATALDMGPTGNYLYLADRSFGMHIINISSPAEPEYLSGYEQTSPYSEEEDEEESGSGGYINIHARETGGRHLSFILDQFLGLRILDITDNQSIEELDQFDMRSDAYFGQLSGVADVTADGNYVFVSDSAFGIAILNYYTEEQEVKINKEAVGQIESPGRASGLALSEDGNSLFLADGDSGLLVADISEPYPDYEANPDHPTEFVQEESYSASGAYAVLEKGGNVFLANSQNGLARLQPSGSPLGYEETPAPATFDPPADATSLAIEGNYAYVLDDADDAEGLRIIELKNADTGRPQLAGFVETPGTASAVAVHETFAWIADGTEGVACVDIADPEAAAIDSTFSTTDARDIKVREYDNDSVYAFIADASQGLVIAEADSRGWFISPTAIPISGARAVAIYEEFNREGDLAVRYALVANPTGMTVVDVTDPAEPVEKGSLDTSANDGQALDVAAKPPYAVVAHGEGGVLLVDLSDPEKPEQIDSFDAEKTAEAVFIQQSYVHTAVGARGALVLGISDTEPASLDPIDIDPDEDRDSPYYNTSGYAADVAVARGDTNRYTYIADTHGGLVALMHSDRVGGGINEQPFEESSDDTGCFIGVLGIRY